MTSRRHDNHTEAPSGAFLSSNNMKQVLSTTTHLTVRLIAGCCHLASDSRATIGVFCQAIDSLSRAIHRLRVSSPSTTLHLQSCFRRVAGMTSRRRLPSSGSHRPFDSLQSASGRSQLPAPTCGTSFRSTSHLHSHSRSSGSVSRLSSSLVPTRTS